MVLTDEDLLDGDRFGTMLARALDLKQRSCYRRSGTEGCQDVDVLAKSDDGPPTDPTTLSIRTAGIASSATAVIVLWVSSSSLGQSFRCNAWRGQY